MNSFTKYLTALVFLLSAPFLIHGNETPYGGAFYSSVRYICTGISYDPFDKVLAEPAGNRLKRIFETSFLKYDPEEKKLIFLTYFEKMTPDKTGDFLCTFNEEDLVSFSYEEKSSEAFTGDWIDQSILLKDKNIPDVVEQDEIPDGQSILDELENNSNRGIAVSDDGTAADPENLKAEFSYTDKNGALRRFFYDNEGLSIENCDGIIFITRNYGNDMYRKSFDERLRLIKNEKLKFGPDPMNVILEEVRKYSYEGEAEVPSSMSFNQVQQGLFSETLYYPDGMIKQVKKSHEVLDETENSEERKKSAVLDDICEYFEYDEGKRIKTAETLTWKYSKTYFGKTKVEQLKTRYDYSYNDKVEKNVPPNFAFYENDVLRMKRLYSSSDDYTEIMYFEDGFSVEAVFKKGVKVRETIFMNDSEIRRRNFE